MVNDTTGQNASAGRRKPLAPPRGAADGLDATMHALLNAADEDSILVLDASGTLLALNEVAARRLGRPVESLVGTCLYGHFEPDLAASRRAQSEEAVRTGRPVRYVDRRIGCVFENHVRPVFGPDGAVARLVIFARDITEQHRAEEERARLERFYRQVLEHLPLEVAVFDRECRYLYVNPAAVRDAKTRAWLIGRSDRDYWRQRGAESAVAGPREAALRRCIETAAPGFMLESIPGRDGTERHFERRFSPVVGAEGVVSQVIGYGVDLTERHRAEEEARLRHEQLVQADKMISLGILVSGVAHEVNNPNQFIMTNAALLEKAWAGALPVLDAALAREGDFSLGGVPYSVMRERLVDVVQGIREGSERIKRIVMELGSFARQEPGTLSGLVAVNAVVGSAVTLVAHTVRAATPRFSVACDPRLPRVRGNAQRLEQVVVNLVVNACQALRSPADAITLETAWLPVPRQVVVRVRDTGVGMAPEVLARVADPFYTTRRSEGGTGLGLSISAAIAREHGGELVLESAPGEGTLATLVLPAPACAGEEGP